MCARSLKSEYEFSSLVLLHYQQAWTVPLQSCFRSTNVPSLVVSLDITSMNYLASPPCARILSFISPIIYLF